MFAVVRTGGKQYRVAPGDKIVVEKLDGNAGDRIELGEVLLAGDGSDLKSTDGLKVAAEIIAQAKGDKVTVFKKRRRHNYRRKKGHRQQHTILRIVSIGDHKAEKKTAPAKAEAPAPAAAAPAAEPTAKPAKAAKPAAADKAPADVTQTATENPAPDNAAAANPPTSEPADGGAKTAKPAKAPSTKSDSSATADAKKSPKAK
jgi:large subunit ribosomal protein L21